MNGSIFKLTLTVMVLFGLSIVTYKWDNSRGVDLVSGSEFINFLDIDSISKFSIVGENKQELIFQRDGKTFNLENFSHYPTSGPQVSDLIYKLTGIAVREKISGDDFKRYQVDATNFNFYFSFVNNRGVEVLSFYVGKSYNSKGNYIRKKGSEQIYLTEKSFEINLDKNSFVEKNILDLDKEEIKKLDLNGEVVIIKKGQDWSIKGLEKTKYKGKYVEEAIDDLQTVEFDDFYAANDSSVATLNFSRGVNIVLDNKMIYKLALARDKDRYFIKAQATLEEISEDIVLNPNVSSEKLQKINDIIKIQNGADNFNLRFKDWVFEISEYEYNKFIKNKNEFSDES